MKVLLLNGSPKANGNTAYALSQMAEVFAAVGVEAEMLPVGNQPIRGCNACGSCRKTGTCPRPRPRRSGAGLGGHRHRPESG